MLEANRAAQQGYRLFHSTWPRWQGVVLTTINFSPTDLVSKGIRRRCYITVKQLCSESVERIHRWEQLLQFKWKSSSLKRCGMTCFTASSELAKTRCGKGAQCLRSRALVPRGIALPCASALFILVSGSGTSRLLDNSLCTYLTYFSGEVLIRLFQSFHPVISCGQNFSWCFKKHHHTNEHQHLQERCNVGI